MAQTPDAHTRRTRLLIGVVATAVVLHGLFFLSIHDMALPYFGGSSRTFDERLPSGGSHEEDVAQRQEMLEHVFKQIVSEASSGTPIALNQIGDYAPPELQLSDVQWQSATAELSESLWDADDRAFELDVKFETTPLDVTFPEVSQASLDPVKASEALLGELEFLMAQEYDPASAKEGLAQEAFEYGNALANRSGMRDYGRDDSDAYDQRRSDPDEVKRRLQELGVGAGLVGRDSEEQRALAGVEASGRVASSHDFAIDVAYAPRPDGQGYLFRLTLAPKSEVQFKTIAQNVFFLVDRSHSISKERYAASKLAIMDALDLLRPGDTFNIHVFDSRVVSFSQGNVPATSYTISAAREFLAQQPHGGLFASTELYASLGNIVPHEVGQKELNTAILLSDGQTNLSRERQRQNIASWSNRNQGKVALYSLAVASGNNLPLLDALTCFNKGSVFYCASTDQVSQTLSTMLNALQNPIGKDIVSSVVPVHEEAVVVLYPRHGMMPNLFRDKPYILYGYSSRLEDFFLFLQGMYYDRFLDIKQRVSFHQAHEVAPAELERQWAVLQAHELYQRYLKDGNTTVLNEARRLLSPYGIPVAFQ